MVRHGESLLNAAHIRQGFEGSLSELGKEQARQTGQRLKKVKFDAVLVSPYERTVETAELILSELKHKKPLEFSNLLVERKNPSEIVNKRAEDPEVRKIVDLIDRSVHDDSYRYSDEENFADLKKRAKTLLTYLATRPEKKLLVVTHSIFLKMVAAYIIKGEALTAKQYNLLSYLNASNNASITIIEYDGGWLGNGWLGKTFYPPESRWKMIAWDDYTR